MTLIFELITGEKFGYVDKVLLSTQTRSLNALWLIIYE